MKKERTVKISKLFAIFTFFLFGIIIYKLSIVCLSKEVDGIDLKAFAESRNTVKEVIYANRGSIYDKNGEILAKNVNSYTVIAYLDSSRTTDPKNPEHVVDKEMTAKALSPLINMTEEKILELLNYDAYQVELGPGGRGLTELVKDQIDSLELPGIDFISSTKRYYPNGDFLSYTLGYAKTDEEENIVGELGIELFYNKLLTGSNGYKEYEQDLYGYQIAGTKPITIDAESGNDIYLTIDTNIQMFAEQAVTTLESGALEWATVSVTNAKTGEILGVASSPSFNPNTKEIVSYYDPFVSYTYEPGSTIKIFSFMAAIEEGIYNGAEKYMSGKIEIEDAVIKDWNNYGWGEITFDEGFYGSSNVAATLLSQKLGRQKLLDFYTKLGFGEQTGIELPNELYGSIDFKYATEIANVSFGQGMSTTAVQVVKALTSIANDGQIINPYIVDKIVNSKGEVVYEGKTKKEADIASTQTIEKIKDLMRGVIDGRSYVSTGTQYNVEGYNVIGKTGTAQIASTSGGYLEGYNDYVRSIALLYPKEDPEVIIYVVASKLAYPNVLTTATNDLIRDVGTYLNINSTNKVLSENNVVLDSYLNKSVEEVVTKLQEKGLNVIKIGNGDKIIKQHPNNLSKVTKKDKIFILTNSDTYYYPNLIGYSRSDLINFANLLGLKMNFSGYGYAKEISVSPGAVIDASQVIEVNLAPKFEIQNNIIKEN